MEPRIQYTRTKDGVSIAYYTVGKGMPLVGLAPTLRSHIGLEWQDPGLRSWSQRLAERRKLVRYDSRGSGLSEREVRDISLETFMVDLQAAVDHLGLKSFALLGPLAAGPVAIAYAARYPERISHLILWCTFARAAGAWISAQFEATRALVDEDWELFTETQGRVVYGWEAGEQARSFASFLRQSITPESYNKYVAASRAFDVSHLLQDVRCPTLVLHRSEVAWPPFDMARDLASRIPGARLGLLAGTSTAAHEGDMEAAASAIDEFLGDEAIAPEAPPAAAIHTILFTDMEASTALTQRLGDAKAQDLLRTHNTIVRDALQAHGGSEIKHTGDGIMASFATASGALECAVAIQRAVEVAHTDSDSPLARPAGEGPGVRVRIGLNAGEPVAEEQDLFGTAVQLARRICDHAEPGQILVADVVRQLAAGKGFLFSDIGDVVPKGFEEPVRLYEVRWRDDE